MSFSFGFSLQTQYLCLYHKEKFTRICRREEEWWWWSPGGALHEKCAYSGVMPKLTSYLWRSCHEFFSIRNDVIPRFNTPPSFLITVFLSLFLSFTRLLSEKRWKLEQKYKFDLIWCDAMFVFVFDYEDTHSEADKCDLDERLLIGELRIFRDTY